MGFESVFKRVLISTGERGVSGPHHFYEDWFTIAWCIRRGGRGQVTIIKIALALVPREQQQTPSKIEILIIMNKIGSQQNCDCEIR